MTFLAVIHSIVVLQVKFEFGLDAAGVVAPPVGQAVEGVSYDHVPVLQPILVLTGVEGEHGLHVGH